MAPLSATPQREMVVDFTEPFFVAYHTVLSKYPDQADTQWRLYINPFRWDVWILILVAVPFGGIIIWIFCRFSPVFGLRERKQGLGKLGESMWYTFGSFLTQGTWYVNA